MTKLSGATLGMAFAVMVLGSFGVDAAENSRVTFTKDVLPILQQSCIECHREGGNNIAGMIAPMSPDVTAFRMALDQGRTSA